MNPLSRLALKVARHLYFRKRHLSHIPSSGMNLEDTSSAGKIDALLQSGQACMIARFGSVEMQLLAHYYITHYEPHGCWDYIRGLSPLPTPWEEAPMDTLCRNAGFFPPHRRDLLKPFCELMLNAIPDLDILGSWLKYEQLFDSMHSADKVHLCHLEPYSHPDLPWSRQLAGRKVLVVHPFTQSIQQQYTEKRHLLFQNPDILPEFDLKLLPAVQSMGGIAPVGMNTWFDALDSMKAQIDACDYDVCLIGCGAYGFPLASHVKRMGKQAIHLGGALQLLFGIKGKRWTEHYGTGPQNPYHRLFNEHWIFPQESERPPAAKEVEGGCYW